MTTAAPPSSRLMRRLRRLPRELLVLIVGLALLLVAARIALPYLLLRLVNDRLTRIDGYAGQVSDISVSVLRGAYTMNGISIYREKGVTRVPFFVARRLDFSLAWRELFHGRVVSQIYLDHAQLHLAKQGVEPAGHGPRPRSKPARLSEDLGHRERRQWQQTINALFPIAITFLDARNSFVSYQDYTRQPHVDLFIKNLHLVASGLRNRPSDTGTSLPASIRATGTTIGGGTVVLTSALEPLAAHPHFQLTIELANVQMRALNDSLRAIAHVDVSAGTFSMVADMAAKDGAFEGYVKPFFNNLKFTGPQDESKPVLDRVWEHIVAGLAWLVKNRPHNDLATKIPFQGRFGAEKVGLWDTIANLFRNGFVQAFLPQLDQHIRPAQVPQDVLKGKNPAARAARTGAG